MVNVAHFDVATLEALGTHLRELDRDGALALVERALADGADLDAVIGRLLAPALVDLGRRWVTGEIGAAEAHAAASITRAALFRAGPLTAPSGKPRVAVCCPDGELHGMPAEMIAELLRAHGWPAEQIGTAVPAWELRGYLARRQPAALLLSCTTPCGFAGAARAIDIAHDVGVPVMVGGAAFGRDDLRALRLGAAAWAPDVQTAGEVLEGWLRSSPPLAPGRALTDDYRSFEAALPDIRAGAFDVLRRSQLRRKEDRADVGPTQDRLELMLRYLGAALLVDDGRLFLDYLSWRLEFFRARQVGPERLADGLKAVAAVVPSRVARLRRLLDDGLQHLAWAGEDRRIDDPIPKSLSSSPVTPEPPVAVRPIVGPDVQQGQVFADLLFLAAMTCQAPMALISVAQPDGQWSTLSYGVDRREALNDAELFAAIAARSQPLEFADPASDERLAASWLTTGPLAVRYVYGIPLRSGQQAKVGVLCVLDRRARELTTREQQAMSAVARQVTGQLLLWRRSASAADPLHRPDRRRGAADSRGPDAALVALLGVRQPGLGVDQHLLRSHEVAVLFNVTERTVINWASSNKLASLRTAGGHLRFRSEDVLALLTLRPARSANSRSPNGD
jgi:excisionase family DNA binding protein